MRPIRLLALLPLLTAPALAQGAAAEAPESFVPVLDALAERVERGAFHGVVAVVELDGERVLEEALGALRLEPPEDMRTDAIFRIFSMTKPVTAVAAMMLVEAGELRLDDPVARHLPELAELTVGVERAPAERAMAVVDLLRHTSGLTYGYFAVSEVDALVREANVLASDSSLAEMVATLGELPLKHQPGTRFEYSLSSDVLGRLVEVVAETTLDRFFEERIFAPLGMRDTGFAVDPEDLDRLAELYERSAGSLRAAAGGEDPTELPGLLSGGGGLFSTADDYARFATMLLRGGELDGVRLLEPETVALMTRDHLEGLPGAGRVTGGGGFGLGVAVVTRDDPGGPRPGSYWWGGAAGTGFWVDPETRMVGVFLIQNMMELQHTNAFQRDVYRLVAR